MKYSTIQFLDARIFSNEMISRNINPDKPRLLVSNFTDFSNSSIPKSPSS